MVERNVNGAVFSTFVSSSSSAVTVLETPVKLHIYDFSDYCYFKPRDSDASVINLYKQDLQH